MAPICFNHGLVSSHQTQKITKCEMPREVVRTEVIEFTGAGNLYIYIYIHKYTICSFTQHGVSWMPVPYIYVWICMETSYTYSPHTHKCWINIISHQFCKHRSLNIMSAYINIYTYINTVYLHTYIYAAQLYIYNLCM